MIKQQPPHYYFESYFARKRNLLYLYHKARIDKVMSLIPPNVSVLDAGCGSGVHSYLLVNKGYDVVGIDKNKECIDFVSQRCTGGRFYQMDLRSFDLDRKFDVVICLEVLEHFYNSQRESILRNLSNHIKDQGLLVVTFPSAPYFLLEPLWRRTRNHLIPEVTFDDDEIHVPINPELFCQDLEKNGYLITGRGCFCFGLQTYILARKSAS